MEDAPVENQGELAVLYALADRSNDDGTGAYPSQEWIAERARCSPRTVRRHLNEMEQREVISRGDQKMVAHFRRDRRPIVWNLNLSAGQDSSDRAEKMTDRSNRAERPDNSDTATGQIVQNGRTPVSYKPSLTPREPSSNRPRGARKRATPAEIKSDWRPTDSQWQRHVENHPLIDHEAELRKFRIWNENNRQKRADWNRAFGNWLIRAKPERESWSQLLGVDYSEVEEVKPF
ncbi:helix-turn-helix domain-containing protein [Corynebacterium auriscanis]|uniref:helix-turn-helix domain-containing protein n=1 Tax=Corynebacterium auriscanis TaxID=99807 RepID=UPI003CE81035